MNENYNNNAENTLTTIATFILVCGIIACVVMGITFLVMLSMGLSIAFTMLPAFIATLFATLVSWSIMKVLANISLTLKDISNKMGEPTQVIKEKWGSVQHNETSKSNNSEDTNDKTEELKVGDKVRHKVYNPDRIMFINRINDDGTCHCVDEKGDGIATYKINNLYKV